MTATVVAGEPFRIGACLGRAVSLYFANFVTLSALGLMVMVPGFMLLLMTFGNALAVLTLDLGLAGGPFTIRGTTAIGLFAAGVFVVALQYLLVAAAVRVTGQSLRGENVLATAALAQALQRGVPIIGLAAATTVVVAAGGVLLIVPGLVIALMVSVAVPVLMVEGEGVFASLVRSCELTRGLRWQLAGFFLVAIGGCVALNAAVALPFDFLLPQEGPMTLVGALVETAVQLFTTVFLALLPTVAYHDLRAAKEGGAVGASGL